MARRNAGFLVFTMKICIIIGAPSVLLCYYVRGQAIETL
ncbi:hypothetical protein PMIT1342_02247 [Prochlorococcus marinus str. MIT 1342]|nr:hypothetical protein PMIT1342_02247 [Prochlorococcus marinus str. MIT 1342]